MSKNIKYYFIIPAILLIIGVAIIIYGAITLPEGSTYMSIGGVITCFALTGLPIVYTLLYVVKKLFKEKTVWSIIFGIVISICVISIISGLTILLTGSSTDKYSVNQVKVVESHINSVVIDYTKYNHNDYMTMEIKKPFFIPIKDGDMINVKYKNGNPKSMYYVIDWRIGEKMLGVGLLVLNIIFVLPVIWIISCVIKGKRGKKGIRNGKE
jgi:hypothetical protein